MYYGPNTDERTKEELHALWNEQRGGLPEGAEKETSVALRELCLAPAVFQPRENGGDDWQIEQHVRELAKLVRNGVVLDPVTVFPIGGRRYVVDGHQRVLAYRLAKLPESEAVPVRHLRQTPGNSCAPFDQALLTSLQANSKTKLSLTDGERQNGAWQLVLWSAAHDNCYSKTDIARATSVGTATVGRMRKVLKLKDLAFDPREIPRWWEVQRRLRGDELGQEPTDAEREARITRWARAFRKAAGAAGDTFADDAQEAFRRAFPQAAQRFVDEALTAIEEGELEVTASDF